MAVTKAPQKERRQAAKPVVVDRRRYEAQVVDVTKWWGPESLQPTIVIGQLNAHYVPDPGPIRHQKSKDYEDRLIEVLRFAEIQNADFCVLPEFSCPLSAAKRILATITKKPTRTAYVLPFEHATVAQYKDLLRVFGVSAFRRKEEAREIELMLPSNTQDGIVNAALTLIPKAKGFEVFRRGNFGRRSWRSSDRFFPFRERSDDPHHSYEALLIRGIDLLRLHYA